MSSKFSNESVIEFMMFANAKPAFAFLTSSSCGLLMKCGHFCEMKPNFQLYAQLFATTRQCWLQSHRVSVSWLLNSSSVFAGELPTMSVCHWMFNRLQTFMGCSLKTAPFGQKKSLCEIIESDAKQQSLLEGPSKLHSWGCRVSW